MVTISKRAARDGYDRVVREELAAILRVSPEAIQPDDRLAADLGLAPLDVSLIALRLERAVRREFPLSVLALVQTVGELVQLVRALATASGGPGRG